MRIFFVLFASLLMCFVVGCGEESEQKLLAPDVTPETYENSEFATVTDNAPAAPSLSKIMPTQCLSWHALPQVDRNQKILDRAYRDEDKYVGDPNNWLTGQCKAWVQVVVYAASNGEVQLPLNHPTDFSRWIDDPENTDSEYCIGRRGSILSAKPGEIVQVRWKDTYKEGPNNLHTFIVVSVNFFKITVIDSNWEEDRTVREHEIFTYQFDNDMAESFTIYSIR